MTSVYSFIKLALVLTLQMYWESSVYLGASLNVNYFEFAFRGNYWSTSYGDFPHEDAMRDHFVRLWSVTSLARNSISVHPFVWGRASESEGASERLGDEWLKSSNSRRARAFISLHTLFFLCCITCSSRLGREIMQCSSNRSSVTLNTSTCVSSWDPSTGWLSIDYGETTFRLHSGGRHCLAHWILLQPSQKAPLAVYSVCAITRWMHVIKVLAVSYSENELWWWWVSSPDQSKHANCSITDLCKIPMVARPNRWTADGAFCERHRRGLSPFPTTVCTHPTLSPLLSLCRSLPTFGHKSLAVLNNIRELRGGGGGLCTLSLSRSSQREREGSWKGP